MVCLDFDEEVARWTGTGESLEFSDIATQYIFGDFFGRARCFMADVEFCLFPHLLQGVF